MKAICNYYIYENFAVKYYVEFYNKSRYTKIYEEGMIMPNIKPISDLRNYNDVLRDVSAGAPVFLTKHGRGRYAIIDMRDYEKMRATLQLMSELAKGKRSGEEKGWLSSEDIRAHFRARADEE